MFVGIDFGTSNSSIAVYQGEKLRFFDQSLRNQNQRVLPSYTYINRDHNVFVGVLAINTYLEEEIGNSHLY